MGVLDDYLVNPGISLLDKTRIQAQVLVPVMRALRAELGRETADAIVTKALRDWSHEVFAAIGEGIDGPPGRKFAKMDTVKGGSMVTVTGKMSGLKFMADTITVKSMPGGKKVGSPKMAPTDSKMSGGKPKM